VEGGADLIQYSQDLAFFGHHGLPIIQGRSNQPDTN
jgi:hypothetical protein